MSLKLGVRGLPGSEVSLIKAFLRFFSHDAGFAWTFAESEPFDAVIVDIALAGEMRNSASAFGPAIVYLGNADAASDGSLFLARPLRSDRFETMLKNLEYARKAVPAAAVLSAPAERSIDPDRENDFSGHRYRLLRWPPAIMLQREPARVRIATMLSRSALPFEKIVQLSRSSQSECTNFLKLLRTAGLIDMQSIQVPAAPPPARESRPTLGSGLIGIFRRKLGF